MHKKIYSSQAVIQELPGELGSAYRQILDQRKNARRYSSFYNAMRNWRKTDSAERTQNKFYAELFCLFHQLEFDFFCQDIIGRSRENHFFLRQYVYPYLPKKTFAQMIDNVLSNYSSKNKYFMNSLLLAVIHYCAKENEYFKNFKVLFVNLSKENKTFLSNYISQYINNPVNAFSEFLILYEELYQGVFNKLKI